jgi:hypothetical protein
MNRKFLEEQLTSIEDEATRKDIKDKIMSKNGESIESHKTEIATLKNDLKVKDDVIENLNTKIKGLENTDIEAIKKEQFDLGKQEGSKDVETFKKSVALKEALSGSKAKDIDLLSTLIDNEKVKYEEKDGKYTVTGLDEQIKDIREKKSFLFEEEKKQEPGINLGGDHTNNPPQNDGGSLTDALKEKYSNK